MTHILYAIAIENFFGFVQVALHLQADESR